MKKKKKKKKREDAYLRGILFLETPRLLPERIRAKRILVFANREGICQVMRVLRSYGGKKSILLPISAFSGTLPAS